MHTLFILLDNLKPNVIPILEIFGFFLLTTFVGYTFFSVIFKTRSWFILLSASAIIGLFGFIFFLGILSYFFKGPGGILLILSCYAVCGLVILFKKRLKFPEISFTMVNLFWFLIACAFLALLFLVAGVNIYGGDVIAYWGFATSFANGNYPLMSPWQPDLLAAHHQGFFLYEGAIYSLIRVNMQLIHSLSAFFIISAGFFFLWGWMREELKTTVGGLLIAMMFYFAFSAIFIVLPTSFESFFHPEVNHQITTLPRFIDAKNRLGGSSNLNEIFYISHRAAAFAGLFLFLFIISTELRIKDKWKFPLLACLAIVTISSEEIVVPAFGLTGISYLISLFRKIPTATRREYIKYIAGSAALSVVLFFIIGSALRDAFLIPSTVPRFQLLLNADSFGHRFSEIKSAILTFPHLPFLVYMPDLFITGIVVVYLATRLKSFVNNLFIFSAIGTGIAFFTVEHTFYPGNQGRFLHLLYLLTVTSLVFELVLLFIRSQIKMRWFLGSLMVILFGVGLVCSVLFLLPEVKAIYYPNYKAEQPEIHPVFSWIQKNAPQKRFFFLDGYLKGVSYSHYTLTGIQNYGILIPVSPAFIKVHTPDYGIEAFDIIDSLDPDSIKDLNINYIFIVKGQEFTFTSQRQKEISNPDFFKVVYRDNEGILYQVSDNYLRYAERKNHRLRDLSKIISKGSVSFLEEPPHLSIPVRSVALLALQETGTIYTKKSSGFFNYIEKKLIYQEPQSHLKYDYVFVDPSTDPLTLCNCQGVNGFFSIAGLKGYQVIK